MARDFASVICPEEHLVEGHAHFRVAAPTVLEDSQRIAMGAGFLLIVATYSCFFGTLASKQPSIPKKVMLRSDEYPNVQLSGSAKTSPSHQHSLRESAKSRSLGREENQNASADHCNVKLLDPPKRLINVDPTGTNLL